MLLRGFLALEYEDGAPQAEQAQRHSHPERRRQLRQSRPDASDLRRVGPRPSRAWRDVVGNRVDLAVADVEPLHLFEVERARAAAVEDRDLVARLVDRAVAVDALEDGQGLARDLEMGDQPRRGLRRET